MSESFVQDRGAPAGGVTAASFFAIIAVLMGCDVAMGYFHGEPLELQWLDLLIFAAALSGFGLLWRQTAAARQRSARLDVELAAARAEARRWSADAHDILAGLGAAIDRQFEKWGLTPAERDVALLQLKGLRHKAIAELRHTSERTVRQQALSIYRKSGLSGRSDLSAFFLEDLLLPSVPCVADRDRAAG